MYVCKEIVIIIPLPLKVAINCNTKKIHTIHVKKTNLTIYMNKFSTQRTPSTINRRTLC